MITAARVRLECFVSRLPSVLLFILLPLLRLVSLRLRVRSWLEPLSAPPGFPRSPGSALRFRLVFPPFPGSSPSQTLHQSSRVRKINRTICLANRRQRIRVAARERLPQPPWAIRRWAVQFRYCCSPFLEIGGDEPILRSWPYTNIAVTRGKVAL